MFLSLRQIDSFMENYSLQDFDLAFFNDGYRIASESNQGGITRLSLIEMARNVYEYIETFTEQFLEECGIGNSKVYCKKGCAYCCHQSVFVLPHEAFYLFIYLKTICNKETLDDLKNKILEKNVITSVMDFKSILRNTKPCPFLENNICSVYEARPMACRLFQSMDVRSCIVERNNPTEMDKYARLYELPLRVGRMMNEGIGAYFTENGLKTTEWIIESSMSLLFNDNKLMFRWLKGEEAFKSRELTEAEWDLFRKFDRMD
jgi:Fe-S-cluster containining protein